MKNFILILVLSLTISACSSKQNQHETDATQDSSFIEDEFPALESEEFDIVDSEIAAEEINQEIQEEIQEAVEEVEVEDRIFFEENSSSLTSKAQTILDNQSAWLKSDPSIKIIIEGHCDERGTREYNIALGEKRANSTKEYLVANGVESFRIKTISYGKERPALVGSSEAVWNKNRRSVTVIEE
ncbi:MAG: peptidoglycan-associated lipoprotein [Lentimonas sp.]|jgi:peptidoglycan-associated lipoprotein